MWLLLHSFRILLDRMMMKSFLCNFSNFIETLVYHQCRRELMIPLKFISSALRRKKGNWSNWGEEEDDEQRSSRPNSSSFIVVQRQSIYRINNIPYLERCYWLSIHTRRFSIIVNRSQVDELKKNMTDYHQTP